eukprot:GFYU01007096.1.p1 GENE.GFYU01007096.1~~GFYU01007096.1.p1  ORF type:complete len:618 (+),score=223.48 GFYU01007096.1:227-2080(+)
MKNGIMFSVLAILLFAGTAFAYHEWNGLSDDKIIRAFAADNFAVSDMQVFEGMRGFTAISNNVTIYKTGARKKVHYVEGTSYQMGYLVGLLTPEEASTMCGPYLIQATAMFFAAKLEKKFVNNKAWNEFLNVLVGYMADDIFPQYQQQLADGVIPQEVADEISGLSRGVLEQDPRSPCTEKRVVALNFMFDSLLGHIYAGALLPKIKTDLPRKVKNISAAVLKGIALLEDSDFAVPDHCNGFVVTGFGNKNIRDTYFGRDFQFSNGGAFQLTNTMIMYVPTDGRLPLVSVSAPGFLGGATVLNAAGVSMGVNLLRSAASNPDRFGLNSILLARSALHYSTTGHEAEHYVIHAKRGVPYMYPTADAHGYGAVYEAVAWVPEFDLKPYSFVEKKISDLLPSFEFFLLHQSPALDKSHGCVVRRRTYEYHQSYTNYNYDLLKVFNVTTSEANWTPRGYLCDTFEEDEVLGPKYQNNYFAPQREDLDDLVLVSNFAVSPEVRLTEMGYWPNLMMATGEAIQWRYDELNNRLQDAFGTFDMEKTKEVLSYLSPDVTPGYWNTPRVDPHNPMTMEISGALSAVDTRRRQIQTKSGYWIDGWLTLNLLNYITPPVELVMDMMQD